MRFVAVTGVQSCALPIWGARVTLPVRRGRGFPAASSALTWTAGLIAAPATVLDGCTVKASWVVVPGMRWNAVLVAGARPLAFAVSVYPVPVLLRLKWKKVATPLTAATGVVPLRIAPPGFVPSATVTLPVKPGTRFPSTSSARTFTAGVIRRFATGGPGWGAKAKMAAAAGVILKTLLVAGFRP